MLEDMSGESIARKSIIFFAAGVLLIGAGVLTGCTLLPAFNSSQAMALSSPPAGSQQDLESPEETTESASLSSSPIAAPSSTITPSATPVTNSNYSDLTVSGHSIIIHNPHKLEVHVFIDSDFVMTVPPGSSGTFNGIQSGTHTFHYCQSTDRLICTPALKHDINGNTEWQIPEFSDDLAGGAQADVNQQSEDGNSSAVNATPTLFPTPRVMRGTFYTIKINNPNPWNIHAFLNEELFLTIQKWKYRTFRSLPPGEYAITYCRNKKMKKCFKTVEITVTGDTELWAFP